MDKTIAVIPARGGSKRIKKKNIIDFYGKPMIAWTIDAALSSGQFSKVIVSTDDPEIAEISKIYGAEVPFLRTKHTDDYSSVSDVTIDAIRQLRDNQSEEYGLVTQLMPNCPLRTSAHIIDATKHFRRNNALVQISCFRFGWMNPWWAFRLSADNTGKNIFPEKMTLRSQDLDPLYCPTGAIWIADVGYLESAGSFYSDKRTYWCMPWQSAIDIDDYDDLDMAKALFAIQSQ